MRGNVSRAFKVVPVLGMVIFLVLCFSSSASAQTSGCGSGKSWYLTRVVTPISERQFKPACIEHDACYDQYGESKESCDKAFYNKMLDICAKDHSGLIEKPLKIRCNGMADIYYNAVKRTDGAEQAYREAQAEAKKQPAYFSSRETVFFYNGRSHCEFLNSQTQEINMKIIPAKVLGERSREIFGTDTGICSLPNGYFTYDDSIYYSPGDKNFCGLTSAPHYERHRSATKKPHMGVLNFDPEDFMYYSGDCQ